MKIARTYRGLRASSLLKAHIAVGGHVAIARAQTLTAAAAAVDCRVVLHPSLPDKEQFGRQWWDISDDDLRRGLINNALFTHL